MICHHHPLELERDTPEAPYRAASVPEAPPPPALCDVQAAPLLPEARPRPPVLSGLAVRGRFGPGNAGGSPGAMRKPAAGFLVSLLKGERSPPTQSSCRPQPSDPQEPFLPLRFLNRFLMMVALGLLPSF